MSAPRRPILTHAELRVVLRRPLQFAARKNYANTVLAEGLGEFLMGVLDRANTLDCVRDSAADLAKGLDRWQKLELEGRRGVVMRWATMIAAVEQLEAPAPRPAAPLPAPRIAPRPEPEPPASTAAKPPGKRRTAEATAVLSAPRERGPLDTPLIQIKGVGPKTADRLAVRELRTVRDALWFLPRRYALRGETTPIADLRPDVAATVVGRVVRHGGGWSRRSRRPTCVLHIADESGGVAARFFGISPRFLTQRYPVGSRVIAGGTPKEHRGGLEIIHPDIEPLGDDDDGTGAYRKVVPLYLEVEGVPAKTVRKLVGRAVEQHADLVPDGVPLPVAQQLGLPTAAEALRLAHDPGDQVDPEALLARRTPAWRRLIFEELFTFQVGVALRRRSRRGQQAQALEGSGALLERYREGLPFALTGAQSRVVGEIRADLRRTEPMNRLLQGDVGSGKTAVALAAACLAAEAGMQTAIMVPTELLAEQHAASIARLLEPVGLRSALLTGSMRRGAREPVLRGLVSGSIDVLVGTHALIQEGVELRALGLVVVDEQHRFGVRQRLSLRQKGREPHVLVMTATPIPRSLSLTVYGDLDVSVLDERPPGRGSVTTTVVAESHRDQVYSAARAQLDEGRQAFFVYPLVEEAEDGALRAATEMATHLAEGPMAGLRVGLIHGGLPPAEKDAVMAAFVAGDLQVLVATTVIEVGIDVPNATIMVVEHAERFGLSQLHQLRGRIGRGDQGHPSTCFLIAADSTTADARRRLAVLARTDDGFEIAEADLRQRGPGEFLGTRQSGLPRFDVADLVRDVSILGEARRAAFDLVDSDPALAGHPLVRDAVRERWAGNLELLEVG